MVVDLREGEEIRLYAGANDQVLHVNFLPALLPDLGAGTCLGVDCETIYNTGHEYKN